MESIGILVMGCCLKLNMCILLPQFRLILVALFGWLTFWRIKRLLGPVMVTLLQEQKEIILNLSGIICKVAWLAKRYFPSLLRSKFFFANSFSIFLLGNNIFMLDFQPPSSEREEEEEIPSPHHTGGSSSSFTETYPYFLLW